MAIARDKIENLNGHKGGIIWFTGLPGSGKTTIANEVKTELLQCGIRTVIIDGDVLRKGLNQDLGFSEADRLENQRRAAEVTLMFVESGFVVLAPLISPMDVGRQMVRQYFEPEDFTELYVKCSLEECIRRDPKGMYRLAEAGKIQQFTGISSPYEPPRQPELILNTETYSIQHCVNILVDYILMKTKTIEKENVL